MTRGDKGKLFILFVPLLTLSLLIKIVCSLWLRPKLETTRSLGVAITFGQNRSAAKRIGQSANGIHQFSHRTCPWSTKTDYCSGRMTSLVMSSCLSSVEPTLYFHFWQMESAFSYFHLQKPVKKQVATLSARVGRAVCATCKKCFCSLTMQVCAVVFVASGL